MKQPAFRLMVALTAGTALAPTAWSQIHAWSGDGSEDILGLSVDGIGDVDGDGFDDVVVGAPLTFNQGWDISYARVFSGATGSLLYEYEDDDIGNWNHVGTTVRGIGDWNADGIPDFLICTEPDYCFAWDPPYARVHSGATGLILREIGVGAWYDFHEQSADGAGDVDADGHADVILGEPDGPIFSGNYEGQAHVYSGLTGQLLRTFAGSSPNQNLGRWVAGVGDWNGDGRDDVAIGSLANFTRVHSVVDGAQLFQVSAVGELDAPGDFNADGQRDLLVGNRVFSGADGSVLLTLGGWTHYRVAGDMSGDGVLDFLASNPTYQNGSGGVAVLSGTDASILAVLHVGSGGEFGHDLALAGDVNSDGVMDVIVGAPEEGSSMKGKAYVFTGFCPPAPTNYCVGAPNSAGSGASMGYEGTWALSNNDLRLRASACPPNHFGIFFYGANASQVPFGNGFLCVGGGIKRLTPPKSTGAGGIATFDCDYTTPPMNSGSGQITAGSTWRFQFWYRDVPGGGAFFNLSDGLAITFCL